MGALLTIIGILIMIIGGCLAVWGFKDGRSPAAISGLVMAVCGLILGTYGLSLTTVDARSVGIETRGGKFVAVHAPGRHTVPPWSDVEQWTTRYQSMPLKLQARFASQSKADVTGIVVWAVTDAGADWNQQVTRVQKLWAAYRTFEDMRTKYAEPTAKTVAGNVFNVYDPFSAIDQKGADNPFISNEEWSKRVTAALGPKFTEAGLTLIQAQITDVDYDDETEARLKATAQKAIDTRNAEQDIELAKKQAEANKERAATAKSCNELMIYLAQNNQLQNLPPAFNCGSDGAGVLVQQK